MVLGRQNQKKHLSATVYRSVVAVFFGLALVLFFGRSYLEARPAPLLANYLLGTLPTDQASIDTLAKFDVLVLSPEQGITRREVINVIKAKNPDVILLAYVPSESWNEAWTRFPANTLYKDFKVQDEWWLRSSNGQVVSNWPGLKNTNISQGWSDYIIGFIKDNILSQGIWDGVFFDIVNDGVSHVNNGDIDLNRDGVKDDLKLLNAEWQKRTVYLFNAARERLPVKYLLMNGSSLPVFQEYMNGRMYETFPTPWEAGGNWSGLMTGLKRNQAANAKPQLYIFNANTNNTGKQNDYKKMRFGLASSLMADNVYFSFDYGDKDHNQVWWYDEYGVDLGESAGEARAQNGGAQFVNDVWRRDFVNGVALVNPTSETQTIDLGGEFERLIGKQDPMTNSGLISDTVVLGSKDGIILRKTFQEVKNAFYLNGSFVRFYDLQGARVRNGFFAFRDGFSGGAKIFSGDLNGNGSAELIAATGPKLEIFNSEGLRWYNDAPFGKGVSFLNLAIGEINPGEGKKIVVAGDKGGVVSIATYYGSFESDPFYPLGKKYRTGFSPAIGDVDGNGVGEIVLATGKGVPGEVLIMDGNSLKLRKRFYPFGAKFTSGFSVATGDFDKNGRDEIAVAAKVNNKISVKVFDNTGKKLSEFSAGTVFGSQFVYLSTADIDSDGKVELIVGSN